MKVPDIENLKVGITEIYDDVLLREKITLSLLRLDEIHPVISGNKIFKLHYFLQQAISSKKKLITFGGAFSNHLAATAAACRSYRLQCMGIVRGEKPSSLSPILSYCIKQGMQLQFISRGSYNEKTQESFIRKLQVKFGDHVLIPEGGFSKEGVQGAAKIYSYIGSKNYTHICCSLGTATTMAGLLSAARPSQQIIGFSALRNLDFEERIRFLLGDVPAKNYCFTSDYHFGGYARSTNELINFMNTFYQSYSVPLDFVYTGKMMFGVFDLIDKNYFAPNSQILCIHTGGLQGNCSLLPRALNF
jgi:1-aminocyclopropane-1-carboxylate deaminase/D-cysteine desulfhydrase-like pyridoxal-dependent ACC family enzyme